MGVAISATMRTMVLGDSVRLRTLTSRMDVATNTDPVSVRRAPGVTTSMPGRRIIRPPTKPSPTASQRRNLTSSARNRAAPTVANRGAVKLRDVASANRNKVSAVNHKNMEVRLEVDRIKWSPSLSVLSPAIPIFRNHGNINRRLKTFRKKSPLAGLLHLRRARMVTLIRAKQTLARMIQMAPFSVPGICRHQEDKRGMRCYRGAPGRAQAPRSGHLHRRSQSCVAKQPKAEVNRALCQTRGNVKGGFRLVLHFINGHVRRQFDQYCLTRLQVNLVDPKVSDQHIHHLSAGER